MVEFINRVTPLPLSPPQCGFIVGINGKTVLHYPFTTAEQAASAALTCASKGMNTYFATGIYSDSKSRKAEFCIGHKSLWLDIDVGKKSNSYPDQTAALNGLQNFIKQTGLKPTIVVSTGTGFSAFYTFTETLPNKLWQVFANILHSLCGQYGLIADPNCTRDAARVMRMPGTLHIKSGNMAKVLIDTGKDWKPKDFLEACKKVLKHDVPVSGTQSKTSAAPPPFTMPAQVMAQVAKQSGAGPQPLQKDAEPVVKNCGQILTCGLCAEPQWYAAMSVLKRFENGRQWAHKLSAMDKARYIAQDTDKKFDHAPEDKPCTCAYFQSLNEKICLKCTHRGKITTPAQLGKLPASVPPQPAPPVAVPRSPLKQAAGNLVIPDKFDYPLLAMRDVEFSVDNRGIFYHYSEKNEQGQWVMREQLICSTQLYYTHTVHDVDDDGAPRRVHWFVTIQPNGKKEEVPLSIHADLSPQSIMRWFYEANMFPATSDIKPGLMVAFMQAYLKSVTAQNKEVKTVNRFGWQNFHDPNLDCDVEGFTIGKGIITESGIHPVNHGDVSAAIARDELSVSGSLATWKHIPTMYKTLDQKAAQLAICLSFAAPLMKYCSGTATSAVYSLWSSASGLGKSQVLRACASVWGHPDRQFIQRSSSAVLRMRKLATLHNLPCFMDELTDIKDEDLYSLAYTLVDGREKQKLKSAGDDVVKTGNWNTVTFTTANKSFKEAASKCGGDSDASMLRVIEYECNFQSYENRPDVQRYIKDCIALCDYNYGLAGAEFIYQILLHRDRLLTLRKRIETWCDANNYQNEERFMSNPLALAVIVGRWCVEFKILDFDMDALEKWITGPFTAHNRRVRRELQPRQQEVIGQYLMDRQLNTLIVTSPERRKGQNEMPPAQISQDSFIVSFPKKELLVRKERQGRTILISVADLKRWCKENGRHYTVLKKTLSMQGIIVQEVFWDLGHDISWLALPKIKCLKLTPPASFQKKRGPAPQPR